jgi:23S rRNA (guanosine2251-2'-O)-methyltransferase
MENKSKGQRAMSNEFIYGINPVLEALKSGDRGFKEILIDFNRKGKEIDEIKSLSMARGIEVKLIPKSEIRNPKSQGVVAVVLERKEIDIYELIDKVYKKESKPVVVILDGIEDPGNLGAIIRSAEALGVGGIIIPRERAAGITPVVVKRSAGAIEHIPVVRVTNISNSIEKLKEKGFWIVGVEAGVGKNCFSLSYNDPMAVVFGGESKGLRRLTKERCDFLVSIPMKGKVSSLNISAACAIIFYEILRQRI